jgi:hypothetical protein
MSSKYQSIAAKLNEVRRAIASLHGNSCWHREHRLRATTGGYPDYTSAVVGRFVEFYEPTIKNRGGESGVFRGMPSEQPRERTLSELAAESNRLQAMSHDLARRSRQLADRLHKILQRCYESSIRAYNRPRLEDSSDTRTD